VILVVAGFLFTLDIALYSIIFQFTVTMALGFLYKGYQQVTLFVITSKSDAVYKLIREETNHAATAFTGQGQYEKTQRVMLYSVVAANEATGLVEGIKRIDSGAFINVIKTEQLGGKFYRRPKD
jgi:uncharacterized membrane-anchored protein YitT (DUF2179 family)